MSGGYISVENRGAYIARFYVKCTGPDGKRVAPYDSGDFTEGFNKSCEIQPGSTNITVKAQEMVFPGYWSDIFIKEYPTVVSKEFELLGTTLDPYYRELK